MPLDTFREVVRTPRVGDYVAGEVAPRFEHGAVWMEPRPTVSRPAARSAAGREASFAKWPKRRAIVGPGTARERASRRQIAEGRGDAVALTAAERRAARRRAALRRTEARG